MLQNIVPFEQGYSPCDFIIIQGTFTTTFVIFPTGVGTGRFFIFDIHQLLD